MRRITGVLSHHALAWRAQACPVTGAVLLFLALAAVYSNALAVPFIYDDNGFILKNPSIQDLKKPWEIIAPYSGVGGRPIVNLSFAINWAISQTSTRGYHVLNLCIHIVATFLLFGVLRQTLCSPRLAARYADTATPLAFICALLWALHPLHTEAVTYIAQRSEALMGASFLLVLYLSIRGWRSPAPGVWHLLAGLAFVLGAGTKEVIAVAPLLIYLYDRVFIHPGKKYVLASSPHLYLGLLAGWALLAVLLTTGTTATFEPKHDYTSFEYLKIQALVIVHYLRLAVAPVSLCFDYVWPKVSLAKALPYAAFLAVLLALTIRALVKKQPAGFLGAWFFLILAPTSSFRPMPYTAWDHRMYLPLAGVLIFLVMGGYSLFSRLARRYPGRGRQIFGAGAGVACAAALVLGGLAHARNKDYASDFSIWSNTLEKCPANYRAYINVANHLWDIRQVPEALRLLQKAIVLKPDCEMAFYDMGSYLMLSGYPEKGAKYLERAVALDPDYAKAHLNLGNIYIHMDMREKGMYHFRQAVRAQPGFANAHANLGIALMEYGEHEKGIEQLKTALRIDPFNLAARNYLQKRWGVEHPGPYF